MHTYKLVTIVEGDRKAPFSLATTTRYVGVGAIRFPGLIHFTFDPYLIMLIVQQGSIKYHFFLFGLISLFNDVSTFVSYLMPKPSF